MRSGNFHKEHYESFSSLIKLGTIYLPLKPNLIDKNLEYIQELLDEFEKFHIKNFSFSENFSIEKSETRRQKNIANQLSQYCVKIIRSLNQIPLSNFDLSKLKDETMILFILMQYPIDIQEEEEEIFANSVKNIKIF